MNIAVIGLGYVGCVTTACFAHEGHSVYGVDVNKEKVDAIATGNAPMIEPGLQELVTAGVAAGRIRSTLEIADALEEAELVFVCVGTPAREDGALNLDYVLRVCDQLGDWLAASRRVVDIVIRSTILPGSSEALISRIEEKSGMCAGKDFGFVLNPEFLREGSAIRDFHHPPFTLIGQLDERSGEKVSQLYADIQAPVYRVEPGVAEMIKYASNAFHALKVVFANEIGAICHAYGIDSHHVMEIFVEDKKLNLGPHYLKPGFAFGGSCLGKDIRALVHAARLHELNVPALESILPSNKHQLARVEDLILGLDLPSVGMIGLSFKQNTDDLRESPALDLAERLLGKGVSVDIYDNEISLSRLHGSNRAYLDKVMPHIATHLRDSLDDVIQSARGIIVTKQLSDQEQALITNECGIDHQLIDLVNLGRDFVRRFKGRYHGIAW